jgi:hypothetical protein
MNEEMYEETLKGCEFGEGSNCPKGYETCGEPASVRVSWDGQKTWLYLCPEHCRKVSNGEDGK